MKLVEGNDVPARKRKPKTTPLDSFEAYLNIKEKILNGSMVPDQRIGILFDQRDCEALGMKEPWRTAAERLRKLLNENGLEKEYEVIKYETALSGEWFVRVTFKPASARPHGSRRHTE